MRVRTIGGVISTSQAGPGKKKMTAASSLAGLTGIMSGEERSNVVPIRPGLGTPSGFENWLAKIEDGSCFVTRRRQAFPLNEVFLDVYQKLSATGRTTKLTEHRDGQDIFRVVDTLAFSQMYEWVETIDVEDSRNI